MVKNYHFLFDQIYKDKTCLVTGHTGFKGSWLAYWLKKMGAKVIGYSLNPPTNPNHFELLKNEYISIIGELVEKKIRVARVPKPKIIIEGKEV